MTEQTPDLTADQVIRVGTDYRYDRRDQPVSPTAEQIAALLPRGWRVSKDDKWQILARAPGDGTSAPADEAVAVLTGAGMKAAEVERETNAVYQFRTGKDAGSGSFLSPPGHPNLTYSIYGYHSPGTGKPRTNRPSGPDAIFSLDGLAEDEGGYYPKADVEKAKRLLAEARTEPSELWMRYVYGYFKNSYSPDGKNRNVSDAVTYHPGDEDVHKCACRQTFKSQQALIGHIAGKRRDLPGRTGQLLHHQTTPSKPLPPEYHLGYLLVKEYFPGEQPRLDLIADPGEGYGAHKCAKCGEHVQYESRHDAFCVVKTQPWSYNPVCPADGGRHTDTSHVEYPHEPGRLHDCPGCEARCHCTAGHTECVFEGKHNGLADTEADTPAPPAPGTGTGDVTFAYVNETCDAALAEAEAASQPSLDKCAGLPDALGSVIRDDAETMGIALGLATAARKFGTARQEVLAAAQALHARNVAAYGGHQEASDSTGVTPERGYTS